MNIVQFHARAYNLINATSVRFPFKLEAGLAGENSEAYYFSYCMCKTFSELIYPLGKCDGDLLSQCTALYTRLECPFDKNPQTVHKR